MVPLVVAQGTAFGSGTAPNIPASLSFTLLSKELFPFNRLCTYSTFSLFQTLTTFISRPSLLGVRHRLVFQLTPPCRRELVIPGIFGHHIVAVSPTFSALPHSLLRIPNHSIAAKITVQAVKKTRTMESNFRSYHTGVYACNQAFYGKLWLVPISFRFPTPL